MDEMTNTLDEAAEIDSGSASDETIDYAELIEKDVFVGEYSFDVLLEYIVTQFETYINLEDNTNYVEIFYEQLHKSYQAIEEDEENDHKEEYGEVLDNIVYKFNTIVGGLFDKRLSLTISYIENGEEDSDAIEYAIQTLYTFFIINARNNFLQVIYKDIKRKINTLTLDDKQYYNTIKEMLSSYSPLVVALGPMEFIRYTQNEEVSQLFNDGIVCGNFLRKYSPKLYENEELEVEIINQVTLSQALRRDLTDGGTAAE